jgi:hypothetical protein
MKVGRGNWDRVELAVIGGVASLGRRAGHKFKDFSESRCVSPGASL